jgi:hypothetical protein
MSELSPIEMKKENVSIEQNKKKSDWAKFGKSILTNLIWTIVIGFIGSNMIYIMYSNLDVWFPSDPKRLPYAVSTNRGLKNKLLGMFSNMRSQFKGGDSSEDIDQNVCQNLKNIIQSNSGKYTKLFNNLGFNNVGFPYTLINEETGFVNTFKNMIGESARYSYVTDREILKKVFRFFESFEGAGENALFILSLPILILLLMFQIPAILGVVTSFISYIMTYFKGMSNSYGWLITIILSFFILAFVISIGFTWCGAIGIAQMFQLYVTLLILPLFDSEAVRQILFCKSHILSVVFTFLTIMSAFNNLENIPAIIMALTLIFLTGAGIAKKNKKI